MSLGWALEGWGMLESETLLDEVLENEVRTRRGQAGANELLRAVQARPTRIVAMGGGTGLPMVLRGLARRAEPKLDEPGLDKIGRAHV